MKKFIILLTTLFILVFVGTASAEISERTVNLVIGQSQAQINGNNVTMSAPATVIDGRTLVPLRFISEAFGCTVDWNNDSKTATVKLVDQKIEVPIGQNYAFINGTKTDIQVPAQLINGSTFVPIKFISENLGAKVNYDVNTHLISILMKTYINKDQGFQMILPADWAVDEETSEGIAFTAPGGRVGNLNFDKDEKYKLLKFDALVEESLKEAGINNILSKNVMDNYAIVTSKSDGVILVLGIKLTNNTLFVLALGIAEDSYNASLVGQCNIIMNSIKAINV